MYNIEVKCNGRDSEDNEVYSFNSLPLFIDKNDNQFKALELQVEQDYLSVPPYRVIEYPVMYIVGEEVKIFVYESDTVEIYRV